MKFDTQKLLNAIDLDKLVEGAGTTLTHSRGEGRGVCPIHGGNNGTAFQVYTSKGRQYWRCWGECNTSGDAIDFIRKIDGLDFVEAVKALVATTNLSLEDIGFSPQAERKHQERKQRTDILDLAAQFYAAQLWSDVGEFSLAYVRDRQFTDDTLRMAGWGFSDGSTALRDHLEAAGADMTIARTLGLVRKDGCDFTNNREGQAASPFGWLVYTHKRYADARFKACPHCERETWHYENQCLQHNDNLPALKNVSYFSARAIMPSDLKDKVRNLPGDRHLYKAEVPSVRYVIICEGPADAESFRQLGYSAWALCGLGQIPEDDLRQLKKRSMVYLALDNDQAGLKNQAKLSHDLGPLTMLMPAFPDGKDANAFLKEGGSSDVISQMLEDSKAFILSLIQDASEKDGHELQALIEQIIKLLKQLPKEVYPFYARETEAALNITSQELIDLMADGEDDQDLDLQERPNLPLLNEAIAEGRVILPRSHGKSFLIEQGISEWAKIVYGIGYGRKQPEVNAKALNFARQAGFIRPDGIWAWAGSVVYADPPVSPDIVTMHYIPDMPDAVRPFKSAKEHHAWGWSVQPLGYWRATPSTTTLVVVPDVFDMLVLAYALHEKNHSNTLAVCTADKPNKAMLRWFSEHPDYEYLLVPSSKSSDDSWREMLIKGIKQGKGAYRTARPPDGLTPAGAVLASWWPKGT